MGRLILSLSNSGRAKYWIGLFLIFLLVACPVSGLGQQKKLLTEADYDLWGNYYFDAMSGKGKWISYRMEYNSHPDTLFVKEAKGKRDYKIIDGVRGVFAGETHFACMKSRDLMLLNLENGTSQKIVDVASYQFSSNGQFLITLEGKGSNQLVIRNKHGELLCKKEGIDSYKLNAIGNALLYAQSKSGMHSVMHLELDKNLSEQLIAESNNSMFHQLMWSKNGRSIAFIEKASKENTEDQGCSIHYYYFANRRLFTFTANDSKDFPSDIRLVDGYTQHLKIADDGLRVFVGLMKKNPCLDYGKDAVQLWNGNDPVMYRERMQNCDGDLDVMLGIWWPTENRFLQVTNETNPIVNMDAKQRLAVTYTANALADNYRRSPDADFYLTDLQTGISTLWLEQQSTEQKKLNFSPDGNYVAYFRNNKWYIYDFFNANTKPINLPPDAQLVNTIGSGVLEVYGVAGWSKDGKSLLLYDKFDLWKINVDGSDLKRLTDGAQSKTVYRIVNPENSGRSSDSRLGMAIDFNGSILLQSTTELSSGYFFLDNKRKLLKIVSNDSWKSGVVKSNDNMIYCFIEERFDVPAQIKRFSISNLEPELVARTNKQYQNYLLGRQEIINYADSQENALKGVLFYPDNYNVSELYPMIVRVYEKETMYSNKYRNPSLYNEYVLNVRNMTAKGYFVLLPNIEKLEGDPGISAADCVVAATREVMGKGLVKLEKIGLIGQSFGGYETNFIITQTDIFAAAVSGAGISDLTSHYLSIGLSTGKSEVWRLENQQWNMKKSLFEDRERYARNSPINFVEEVSTPLFIWAGDNDPQVHYYQSIYLYNALRRLGKSTILALYPQENHVMLREENQKDLTLRTESWFGYFLKDEIPEPWILKGIQ